MRRIGLCRVPGSVPFGCETLGGSSWPYMVPLVCISRCGMGGQDTDPYPGMHWKGARYSPPPSRGPAYSQLHLSGGKCQFQWHL